MTLTLHPTTSMQPYIPFKHLDIVQLPCMFIHTQMLACCLCYIASHLNILMFFGPICIPFKYARLIMRLSLGATERLLHCDLEKQSFCFVWGVKAAYICPPILGESLVHCTGLPFMSICLQMLNAQQTLC